MPPYQRIQTLYCSGLVKVFDVCCRAECRTCSAEEYASGHLLVLPRAGICVQHRSRREEIVTDATRLLFFNRDEPCRFSHPVPGGDDCTAIAFEETKLHAFLCANDPATMDRLPQKPFLRPTAAASAPTTLLLQRLRQHLFLGAASNALVVEETVAHLLTASLHAAGTMAAGAGRRTDTRAAHRALARETRLILAARYRERLTLSALAREVFSSPFHLARVFRRETNQSIHGYVLRLRLQASLEHVVSEPAVDLTALALELGFSSHAHFSDAFRRQFGETPSGVRRHASGQLLKRLGARLMEARLLSERRETANE